MLKYKTTTRVLPLKLFSLLCRTVLISLATTVITGCEFTTEESTDVSTADIFMTIQINEKSNSETTKITVNMREKNIVGKSIKLSDGEYLDATFANTVVRLSRDSELLEIDYDATINTGGKGGEIIVTLHRAGGNKIANSIVMPESFSVTNPMSGHVYHEGDELTSLWSPVATGNMNVHGHITCATIGEGFDDDIEADLDNENETWLTSDTGSFVVPIDELARNMRLEVTLENENLISNRPCSFDVELYRENRSDRSSIFATGSYIYARKSVKIDGMELYINGN